MATTAKERLMARAANLQVDKKVEALPLPKPTIGIIEQQREARAAEAAAEEAAKEANRQKTLAHRQKGLSSAESTPENKTPISDRAKRVSAIRAGLKTEAEPSKLTKAGQSIGLNTMGSVEYLIESAKQSKENTQKYIQSEEAQNYAAAVSEFNRIRKYYDESAPEYQAALEKMELAKAGAQKAEADARSVAVDQNSRAAKLMGESRRLQEEALEGTTGAGRFLGETALSMASVVSKLPLGAAAPLLMGAEAAANKAYDLGQQGVGANQALLRGVGAGAIESVTEKVPLDNLFSLVKNGGKSALKNILKQGGIEATEEGLSYLMNLIADKAAKDPNAQFSVMDLAKSAGGGLISGLAFGAGGTVLNNAQSETTVQQTPEAPATLPLPQTKAVTEQTLESNNTKASAQNQKAATVQPKSLPIANNQNDQALFANTETQAETAVKETGLPLPRQESLQQAAEASVTGKKTLGEIERRTGLPIPSAVGNQLQAVELLSGQLQEDEADIANTIRKYVGEDAALYWLQHKDEDAGDFDSGRPTPEQSGVVRDENGEAIGTKATEKLGVKVEGGIADLAKVQSAREAQWGLDAAEKQIQKAERELHASAAEKRMAENVAKGIDTLDSYVYGWDGKDNRRKSVVQELSALYRLRDTYDKHAVKSIGRKNKDNFIYTLNKEILNNANDAAPPGITSLHTNTWERNNLRTWGKTLGEKVNNLIFYPIRRNEANRIRWLNNEIDSLPVLAELTEEENKAVFDMLDSGKETAAYDGVRNDVVQQAAEQLRQKYSDYYDAINDVLVAHGYPEIGFIKNYAPHTQEQEKNLREAMSIFERLGLSENVNELPTAIAGRTDVFKPGKKWDPHFLHRKGEKSAQDAVGGYLSYVNYMSEVLHHVDDIQKVRTFSDQIRYIYGDEGMQQDYDAIRNDRTMNEQEKEAELEKLRERQLENTKMGGYVTALDNYANILAGKQTQLDRSVENTIGRKGLNWIQKPMKILTRSSIPGNLSSAINQTVQLPWLTAETGEKNVIQAAYELATGKLKQAELINNSDFLTGKRGAESLNKLQDKTAGEKILDAASVPFEVVDDAVSQVIVRAFQLKNIKSGMDPDAALREADKQAERLVGSRMKGARPNVFSDKSLKAITTFQLEVANQWQHLKHDLPQEFKDAVEKNGKAKAGAEAAKRILKGTLYTAALNNIIEQITGNRPASFDVIGTIWDYVLTGLPDEEEEEKSFDFTAGLKDAASSVVDDLPFIGNIGALVGFGDGRLPIPTVDQKVFTGLGKAITGETKEDKSAGWKQARAGALKSAATMVPMGNQIKKTIQGGTDVIRGGRYTDNGKQLMYEVEQTPANYARGLLFGRNALPETREYWDEGGKSVLSAKQTELMQEAKRYGIDQSTYVDFITQSKKLEGDKDVNGDTVKGSKERKQIDLLNSMDLTDEQRMKLYMDHVASDSRKEAVAAMGGAGMTWETIAPAITTYLSIDTSPGNATEKATRIAAWADQNLTGRQAEVVKDQLRYWQNMPAEAASYEKLTAAGLDAKTAEAVNTMLKNLQPESGKEQVSQSQKLQAVASSKTLTEDAKQKAVSSILDADAVPKFQQCVNSGISVSDYVDVKLFYSNATADKDKNGKSISGSKKEKVWNHIDTLQITPTQKDLLSILCTYDSKLEEAPWNKRKAGALPVGNAENKSQSNALPLSNGGTTSFALPLP